MNAVKYAVKDVKVNDGTVRTSEVPVFVGLSKVTDAVNGRFATMSITVDRDWVWCRLSSQPSEKYKSKLVSCGFTFSRKRLGWHAPLSELVCKTLREFGAHDIQHHKLVGLEPPRTTEIQDIRSNIDVDQAVEDAIKNKVASKPATPTKKAPSANSKKIATLEEQNAELRQAMMSLQQVVTQQSALLATIAERMLAS